LRAKLRYLFESVGGLVIAFVRWEAVVRAFSVPSFILPPPSAVLAVMAESAHRNRSPA
jgi:ABC-type nitrate/sulfonate/bicarbonate transport system permease component